MSFPEQPPPAPAQDRPDVPTWALLGLVLLILVASVVVGLQVWSYVRGNAEDGGPPHPAQWDPRIKPYADAVERLRGLDFLEPVYVDFLSAAKFRKEVTEDETELDDAERKEMQESAAQMASVGLIPADIDIVKTVNDLTGSGTLGLYDTEDERIRLRGTKLDLATKSTLVHELTHVLQDQHFSIGRRFDDLDEASDKDGLAGDHALAEASGLRAITEGDARRVETLWAKGLSAGQQRRLETQQARTTATAHQGMKAVPEAFQAIIGSPYMLGEAALDAAAPGDDRSRANAAADRLLRSPPTTEEQLIDPWLKRAAAKTLPVDAPHPGKGEKEIDSGEFGAFGWYLVLAERIPLPEALAAVDGWGGDRYLAFTRDGTDCMRLTWRGDTRGDLAQMASAVRHWIAARPGWPATVDISGTTLTFGSCTPGRKAAPAKQHSLVALGALAIRTYATIAFIDKGWSRPIARCTADGTIAAHTKEQLATGRIDEGRVHAAFSACT